MESDAHVPAGALAHTQPLVAVLYTPKRSIKSAVSLMVDPPDGYAAPISVVYFGHN